MAWTTTLSCAENACDQQSLGALVDGIVAGTVVCDAGCDVLTCDTGTGEVVGLKAAAHSDNAPSLHGKIPHAIASLSSLASLELHGYDLTGTLPAALGSLHNLTTLHIESAPQLSGWIPMSFGSLSALRELHITDTSVAGPVNDTVCMLKELVVLNLDSNDLAHEIVKVPSFVTEFVWTNESSGWNSTGEPQQVEVNRTVLLDKDVFYPLPSCLGDLHGLTSLRLGNNKFYGEIPNSLMGLVGLESVDLQHNLLSGSIPSFLLGGCNTSTTSNTPSSSSTTASFSTPAGGDGFMACTRELPSLRTISLDGNRLSGPLPPTASNSLSMLTVSGNQLTGSLPGSLLNDVTAGLSVLNLNANRLTGTLPLQIASMSNLIAFFADENEFTGELPLPGGRDGKLVVMMASSNSFESVDSTSWCAVFNTETGRPLRCGLSNTNIPCTLECGVSNRASDDIDLNTKCGTSCSCTSNFVSFLGSLSDDDPMTTAFQHVAETVSCPQRNSGDTCEYSCAAGFQPGFVDTDGDAVCAIVSESMEARSALPAHILTCDDGQWQNVDADGLAHGCVEAVCSALTLDDVPHAVAGQCANTPSGLSCEVECLPGYTREGDSNVECVRGTWDVKSTQCVAIADTLDIFRCSAISNAQVANIAQDSCAGTAGYRTVERTTTSTTSMGVFDAPGVNTYSGLISAVQSTGTSFLAEGSVECEYDCAPGYHPNPAAPRVVSCVLGRWEVRETNVMSACKRPKCAC